MKIRSGFVSNSSSSSFVLLLDSITPEQVDMIYDHISVAKEYDKNLLNDGEDMLFEYYESWNIVNDGFSLWCYTTMDNFDLETYIQDIVGVEHDKIHYIGCGFDTDITNDEEYILLKRKHSLEKIKNIINK